MHRPAQDVQSSRSGRPRCEGVEQNAGSHFRRADPRSACALQARQSWYTSPPEHAPRQAEVEKKKQNKTYNNKKCTQLDGAHHVVPLPAQQPPATKPHFSGGPPLAALASRLRCAPHVSMAVALAGPSLCYLPPWPGVSGVQLKHCCCLHRVPHQHTCLLPQPTPASVLPVPSPWTGRSCAPPHKALLAQGTAVGKLGHHRTAPCSGARAGYTPLPLRWACPHALGLSCSTHA